MGCDTPLLDCHMHSRFSLDSNATIESMCRAACRRDLRLICLTEHVDFDPRDPGLGYFDYEGYKAAIAAAQERWRGQLDILGGIEVDYQRRYQEDIVRFLDGKEFDFVLGSVHACRDGWFVPEFLRAHSEADAYGLYFSEMKHLIHCGQFDCISHFDVVKRFGVQTYGPFDFSRWAPVVEELLTEAVKSGLAMEINASGLRQAPGETYPGVPTMELYRSLGGEMVTVGSDAHRPEDVGEGVSVALAAASEAGFDQVTIFRNRGPEFISVARR